MKQAGIRKSLIDRALSSIVDDQQANKIEKLARKKIKLMGYSNEGSLSELKSQLNFLEQQKVIKYLFQKGYLLDLCRNTYISQGCALRI